ncbi:MAG TPA: tRNA uridine-5-carboxymethylaminomethyl(34) synthesis GTPase MnmE, partial [Lachnospiraceae bacterium]|nr:tRNA uridine-5-carboxymethylaminomethyl(34) synthesis GTPase MnmE [Lachnospiraceae bacterium]
TDDIIEKMGVRKALEFVSDADLILCVIDSSTELDENDEEILQLIKEKKAIILLNKSDLESAVLQEELESKANYPIIPFSAKQNTGME